MAEETGYHAEVVSKVDTITYEFNELGQHFRKTVHYFLMRLLDEDEKSEPDLQEGEVYENLWLSTDEARRRLTHDESKGLLEKALVIRAVDSV